MLLDLFHSRPPQRFSKKHCWTHSAISPSVAPQCTSAKNVAGPISLSAAPAVL
jgi:hypothetical protein